MSNRDPYPYPKLENDLTLSGFRPKQTKYNKPTHIAQTEEPWTRLYGAATVASTRHSVLHQEREAPCDSLDIHLRSAYDQHKDFSWNKNQVLYQKEPTSENGGSQQVQATVETVCEDIRKWVDPKRCSIYSIK
ncbi:cilia- and flagella-associated protein 276 [Aulostomus maculatus]